MNSHSSPPGDMSLSSLARSICSRSSFSSPSSVFEIMLRGVWHIKYLVRPPVDTRVFGDEIKIFLVDVIVLYLALATFAPLALLPSMAVIGYVVFVLLLF